jgi:hypothetical protein
MAVGKGTKSKQKAQQSPRHKGTRGGTLKKKGKGHLHAGASVECRHCCLNCFDTIGRSNLDLAVAVDFEVA